MQSPSDGSFPTRPDCGAGNPDASISNEISKGGPLLNGSER